MLALNNAAALFMLLFLHVLLPLHVLLLWHAAAALHDATKFCMLLPLLWYCFCMMLPLLLHAPALQMLLLLRVTIFSKWFGFCSQWPDAVVVMGWPSTAW